MTDGNICPVCSSVNTTPQLEEFYGDEAFQVRTCDECKSEYEVIYGDPIKREIRRES